MKRRKTRSSLAVVTVLGMLLALLPLAAVSAVGPEVIAYDMVGSSSQNLTSFTNVFDGAFGSGGDGFQKYQRGVSSSIPFAVLDDSLVIFTPDSLGVVKDGNTDVFFGMVDTQNGDNSGPVSATWVFDVAGISNLGLSIDMGAMGDFEGSDYFEWTYSFDGGPSNVVFASTVDEAAAYTYTLEGGASFTLNDPMLVDGVVLTNDLAAFAAPLTGAGSSLSLTLTAVSNGGSEGYAFQDIVVSGLKAVVVDCGSDLSVDYGLGSTIPVSASDIDDIAVLDGISVDPTPAGGSITLTNVVPTGDIGGSSTGDVVVSTDVPPGLYDVTVNASNGVPETASCTFTLNVVGLVKIHDIQGAGNSSPLVGGEFIIEGVVTGDFQGTATDDQFEGFHLQEQDGEVDGDPMTSEGIFVFAPSAPDLFPGGCCDRPRDS